MTKSEKNIHCMICGFKGYGKMSIITLKRFWKFQKLEKKHVKFGKK